MTPTTPVEQLSGFITGNVFMDLVLLLVGVGIVGAVISALTGLGRA